MKESGAACHRAAVMNAVFDDACVEGWEELLGAISLPDESDRHVVAAVIQGRADLIVTANLKDFPTEVLGRFNLETQHPDEFFVNQLDPDPAEVMRSLQMQASATRTPPSYRGRDPRELGAVRCLEICRGCPSPDLAAVELARGRRR